MKVATIVYILRLVLNFSELSLRGFHAFNEGQNPISPFGDLWPITTVVCFVYQAGLFYTFRSSDALEASA